MVVLGGSLIGSTLAVVMGGANVVHTAKKDYVLKADQDIYRYIS